ncbi:MAG: phosphotransferase family protein [Acidimicrobiia bacterium]
MSERRQANRSGQAVLLVRGGQPIAFVRVRRGLDPETDPEVKSLRLLRESRPRTFRIPEVLAAGRVKDWGYVALSALPVALHRPPRRPALEAIIEEIQTGLEALPRPDGTPRLWVPMHGDLTPWNLRRLPDGDLVLLDWERAGWGPPGADQLLYQASEVAFGWRSVRPSSNLEAVRFWQGRIAGRSATDRDRALSLNLARALEGMVVGAGAARAD